MKIDIIVEFEPHEVRNTQATGFSLPQAIETIIAFLRGRGDAIHMDVLLEDPVMMHIWDKKRKKDEARPRGNMILFEFTNFDIDNRKTWPPESGKYLMELLWIHPHTPAANSKMWDTCQWDASEGAANLNIFAEKYGRTKTLRWARLPEPKE